MPPDILSTAQAAAFVGLTPASFRVEVSRSPMLRAGRVHLDARTPGYPLDLLVAWKAARPSAQPRPPRRLIAPPQRPATTR